MKESERASIHETMEQQTISFAKAGIITRLNARTSILAAANPIFGRYDTRYSPSDNIDLPASLLTRFDLLWLVLDRADETNDKVLAKHIIHVHMHKGPPKSQNTPYVTSEREKFLSKINRMRTREFSEHFPPKTIRSCVACVQRFHPFIPEELTEWLALIYAEIRQEELFNDQTYAYTTARSLLSLLRMSQALTKLKLNNKV
jgi:DNA replication licensing factor MCM7